MPIPAKLYVGRAQRAVAATFCRTKCRAGQGRRAERVVVLVVWKVDRGRVWETGSPGQVLGGGPGTAGFGAHPRQR